MQSSSSSRPFKPGVVGASPTSDTKQCRVSSAECRVRDGPLIGIPASCIDRGGCNRNKFVCLDHQRPGEMGIGFGRIEQQLDPEGGFVCLLQNCAHFRNEIR